MGAPSARASLGVENRRQFLVLHVDLKQRLFGGFPVHRGYGGHPFADEPHAVISQDGHVVHAPPVPDAPHVLPGQDGVNARNLQGP